MEQQGRSFNCNRCNCLVIIQRANDHGNIYCSNCVVPARQESVRAAKRRYQNTTRGKRSNAKRQACYRQRQQKIK